jgi:hypothetical protein
MTAQTQPVGFAGALQLSADPSLPADAIPFNFSGALVALASGILNITGPGTTNVPFNGAPAAGAKGILIRYDAQTGAAALTLSLNSATPPIELTPGSLFVYFDANPAAGVTSAAIAATVACQVRYWIFG